MSEEHRKILTSTADAMMSESLQKIVSPAKKHDDLKVMAGSKTILQFAKVYWVQKNAETIEISCGIPRAKIKNIFRVLYDISHDDFLTIDYCGTILPRQLCKQWRIIADHVDPMGETKVELVFITTYNSATKEILND